MFRVIIGGIIDALLLVWLMIITSANVHIVEVIITIVFIGLSTSMIYFGIKMMKTREKTVGMALASLRLNGKINYTEITTQLNISELKAQKFISWGHKENVFFNISKDGNIEAIYQNESK